MAFRFAPRALLELGRELISSDEVALYELIKNAVDAGSPRVEIAAHIVLPHSAFVTARDGLDAGRSPTDVLADVEKAILPTADAAAASAFLAPLRRRLRRPTRFRAALIVAYNRQNWLEVRDTGHGMSRRELDEVYLTVGTRSRREANIAGAAYLGDKGVGRLSAMRLGDGLTVSTTRKGEGHWSRLRVNWRLFTHETERDLSLIPVDPVQGDAKADPEVQGTRIRISGLAADWSWTRFAEIAQGPVARLVDPFEQGLANRLLVVRHNGVRVVVPSIPEKLLATAHATCKATLRFDPATGEPVLEGVVAYGLRNRSRPVAQRGAEVYTIAQNVWKRRGKRGHAATVTAPIRPQAIRDLGPVDVEVYWFNRRIVQAVADLTANVAETREQISRWSGGPMLYRRDFRILPYGDPDDDWIELDRNAFGQSGFKLNRRQVIGRVKVDAGHEALSEQTNREGLVRSDAADALTVIVKWLLHSELRQLINDADAEERLSRRQAERMAHAFRETQALIRQNLTELRGRVAASERALVDSLGRQVELMADQCDALIAGTEQVVRESVDEREKFVELAGIGLMTEFIFHEMDRSVGHTLRLLKDAGGPRSASLSALSDQLTTLQKRVSAFDELAGERRQVKSTFDLCAVVRTAIDNHQAEFARHGIQAHFACARPVMIKAVRGMTIQILENLIANAAFWLKQQARYEPGFTPQIWFEIDPDTLALMVEDNGPGVDPSRREAIFDPFVSSKPPGQGRGLGLYISRELAQYHGWRLDLDPTEGRRRRGRLNMFVLDMSA